MSEFDIIRRYFAESGLQFERAGITLGIGDDAALLQPPPDSMLAISMDVLVESIHFPANAEPALIAQRALAVNLSDMAAMAAEPLCFTLGLTLPHADDDWLSDFSAGLLVLAQRYNCPLVGGDLSRGPFNIAIQVHGLVAPDRVMRRSGAGIGDQIYVSGCLGDGAIALASMGLPAQLGADFLLKPNTLDAAGQHYFKEAFYKPEPRIELARACAPYCSSGIDISDGLAGDLGHILRANGVGAVLNAAAIPYSSHAEHCMTAANRQLAAFYGGDDYELCVTVAPEHCAAVEVAASACDIRFTRIGEIVIGAELHCIDETGISQRVGRAAFEHFRNEAS